MDIKTMGQIVKWMENTDLSEILWRRGKIGVEISLSGPGSSVIIPEYKLIPVSSPAVGIYRLDCPGRTSVISQGMRISKGQKLGCIEIGSAHESVISSEDGILRILCVADGQPVQYGQPLFFITQQL